MTNSVSKLDDAQALIQIHVPAEIRDVLGKPPLLANEDPNQYDALLAELARGVKPGDVVDWLWVKDIGDLTWDIIRYRRIKAAHVNGRFKAELARRLKPVVERDYSVAHPRRRELDPAIAREQANRLANDCCADVQGKEKLDTLLKANGIDAESIMGNAFVAAVGPLEAIERLRASAEVRRDNALREIERRRSALGYGLRQTSDQVIEGETPLVPLIAG
jgi:hypothetical protein